MKIELKYSKDFLRNKTNKIVDNITIDNITIDDILKLFFDTIDKTLEAIYNYPNYVNINTDELKKYIIEIYLNDIYNVFEDIINNVNVNDYINPPMSERHPYNYCDQVTICGGTSALIGSQYLYIDFYVTEDWVLNRSPAALLRKYDTFISEEHWFSAKSFRQKKGLNPAFEYMYGIIKNIDKDDDGINFDYIKVLDVKDINGNPIPFKYKVESIIHDIFFKEIIKKSIHPAGFNGEYKRVFPLNFYDNLFCKPYYNYSYIFLYDLTHDTYSDIRKINLPNYNAYSEVESLYTFSVLNKRYMAVYLENGLHYSVDYNNTTKLFDINQNLIKDYGNNTSIIPITFYLNNIRIENFTDLNIYDVDDNLLTGWYKITDVTYNDNSFLQNYDCTITLENGYFYRILNNNVILYDDNHNSVKVFTDKLTYKTETNMCKNVLSDKLLSTMHFEVETPDECIYVGNDYVINGGWFINGCFLTGHIKILDYFKSLYSKVFGTSFSLVDIVTLKSIFSIPGFYDNLNNLNDELKQIILISNQDSLNENYPILVGDNEYVGFFDINGVVYPEILSISDSVSIT